MNRCFDNSTVYLAALAKGDERYAVLFNAAGRVEALRTLGRWAGHDDLSFTWYDAARMSREIRKVSES